MNTKPDTFVMMCALMSDKMVQQSMTIGSLEAHIVGDHAEMDEMQRTITDLRRQLETANDKLYRMGPDNYYQRRCGELEQVNSRLYEEVRQLRRKAYGEGESGARAYMEAEGAKLWETNKIATIKGVRECTGWGLKETKDWCEAYSAHKAVFNVPSLPSAEVNEESGPTTKRSQQVPEGVGVQSKRSA